MSKDILVSTDRKVNNKIVICIDNKTTETLLINDLLENIKILIKYIIAQKRRKLKKMKIKTQQKNIKKIPKLRFGGFEGEWEEKRLGEVCKITTGKLDANAMIKNGKYRFYTCAKDFYQINDFAFDTEALLISGNGANVGYIHYYKGKFNAYQRTYVLNEFNQNIFFVKIYLDKFLSDRINKEKKEGNTPYIVLNTLAEMKIQILSIKEQQKIASFLGGVDEWIENLREQKKNIELYKKGMMQKIFSQEIRFKYENGKNFPDWEEKRLGEVLDNIPTKPYQIKNTKILKSGKYKVVDQGKNEISGYSNDLDKLFENNGVIIFGDHTTVLKYINFNFIVGADGTKILKNKEGDLKYLYYNLIFNNIKSEGYKRHFSILRNTYLQIPKDIKEQQKIANFLTSIDKSIELKQQQITQAQQWKKGLMQGLFV